MPEGQVRHRPESHRDLLAVSRERLAGAEPERGSWPAPVVQAEFDLGERLGLVGRVHALLVEVGRNVPAADAASQIPGTASVTHDVLVGQRPHRAQDVDFAVAQISFAEADRRFHGHQA
jgi:hypothetical protein